MQRLYGREDVLARVHRGVERACAGEGRLFLFTGEPGIGKSRLAEHAAELARARGAMVAWGRCWEAGGAPPYWPWSQVFRDLGLEQPFTVTTEVTGEARFAVFERAVRALKAAAAERPLAVVLDDLHAADAPSLLLLLLLGQEIARAPILVLAACRLAEAPLYPEISPLLARIARQAEVVPLERLSSAEVDHWVREAGADAHARDIYQMTEGHPLFVVEALRLGPRLPAPAGLPPGLTALLDERLSRLSRPTRSILEVAAVLGRDVTVADVAATADRTADEAFTALREAADASIVLPGAEPGRFRFSHVLLRDRLYDQLLPSRRAALHTRAGQVLRATDARLAVHHLLEGQSAGNPVEVAEAALTAAGGAVARLAFEDAIHLGERALALGSLSARLEAELKLAIAEASIRLGDSARGKRLCVEAAALAQRASSDELLARAALIYGTELASGTTDPQMIALLRQALARLGQGDSLLRARLMVRLAAALTPPASIEEGPEILALARGATAMARRMEDAPTLLYVLFFAATVALLIPEDERFLILQETVELARALDQQLVLLTALPAYLTAMIARGERARAEAMLPAYDELLAQFHLPSHRQLRLLIDALLALLRGDPEAEERASAEALAIAQRSGAPPLMLRWMIQRMSAAQLRGQPALLVNQAQTFLAAYETAPRGVPYVSWILAGLSQRDEAVRRLSELDVKPAHIPSSNLIDLMGAAETCVLLEDRAMAEVLYPRLLRAADRMFVNIAPGSLIGPTARALGDMARVIERTAEAIRHYDEAIAFCEKMGETTIADVCRARRALVGAAAPVASVAERTPTFELRRDGEIWTVTSSTGEARLRHSKGLTYLRYLLDQPSRQVHVLELAGIEHQTGDAGQVLDERAKAEYRGRLDDLRDQLAEAERFQDALRAQRIEQEIDALAEQLAGAVGLGGRDRRAASDVERTRINVQRRLKDAIDRIGAANPTLGRYLGAAVKTGTYCVYQPL